MRKLVVGLLALVGLVVLVDFGAAAYAEFRLSRELREGADLESDPSVTIRGFSFLAQAINGKYEGIDIRAQGVRSAELGEIVLEASLEGVSIPFSDLVDGAVTTVPVDKLYGRIKIDATELGQLYGIADLQVSAPPADKSDGTGGTGGSGTTTDSGVVLTGTIPVGDGAQQVSVRAELVLDGNRVHIVATDFATEADGAPATSTIPADVDVVRPAVLARFSRTIDTRSLPFGVVPTSVSAQGSQIVIEGEGENVVIDLDQLRTP